MPKYGRAWKELTKRQARPRTKSGRVPYTYVAKSPASAPRNVGQRCLLFATKTTETRRSPRGTVSPAFTRTSKGAQTSPTKRPSGSRGPHRRADSRFFREPKLSCVESKTPSHSWSRSASSSGFSACSDSSSRSRLAAVAARERAGGEGDCEGRRSTAEPNPSFNE